MNIDDFRYMWRGKPLQPLAQEDANILSPVNIRKDGQERALLLFHGFSSTPAVYRQIIPSLKDYDAIVCPALPGHAISFTSFSAAKACDWIAAAEDTCADLIKNYQKVDVVGFSLGGLLACHLSQRFNLNHLYLLAPALALRLPLGLALKSAKLLRFLGFHSLRNRAGNLHTQQFSEIAFRQLPLATIIEILTLVSEFKFTPPRCPTEVFLGLHDEVVDSERVAKLFTGIPQTTIHWLPESAHVLPLDGNIDTIVNCINTHCKT